MEKTLQNKRSVWVSFRFRWGKASDVEKILKNNQTYIKNYNFFYKKNTEEGAPIQQMWPGSVFIQIELINGKINPDTREFIRTKIKDFSNFHTFNRTYNADPILFSDRGIIKMQKQAEEDVSQDSTMDEKNLSKDINLELGDLVTILSGAFRGHEGEVVKIDKEHRLISINAEFFGRITTIELPFEDCRKFKK